MLSPDQIILNVILACLYASIYSCLAIFTLWRYSKILDPFQVTVTIVYMFGFLFKVVNWTVAYNLHSDDIKDRAFSLALGFVVSSVFFLILHIFTFKLVLIYKL